MLKAALAAGPQVLESNRWDASNLLIGNTNTSGDITTYKYDGDGNRDGWEPQYKKRQLDIYFTNDITMGIPQPLTASGRSELEAVVCVRSR